MRLLIFWMYDNTIMEWQTQKKKKKGTNHSAPFPKSNDVSIKRLSALAEQQKCSYNSWTATFAENLIKPLISYMAGCLHGTRELLCTQNSQSVIAVILRRQHLQSGDGSQELQDENKELKLSVSLRSDGVPWFQMHYLLKIRKIIWSVWWS